jgi:hypothetical protein
LQEELAHNLKTEQDYTNFLKRMDKYPFGSIRQWST